MNHLHSFQSKRFKAPVARLGHHALPRRELEMAETIQSHLGEGVDAVNRRFSKDEKYSNILAESPSLIEAKNAYMTYCKQEEFPKQDGVRLVSALLKDSGLNLWMSKIEGILGILNSEPFLSHLKTSLIAPLANVE